MKVVILCGGLGTRLREETEFRPKPMVEIGGQPMLWHIMRHYAKYGFDEFVLCLGYKGDVIRSYVLSYLAMHRDVRVSLGSGGVEYLEPVGPEASWKVTLAETGRETPTGGRILAAARHIGKEPFLCTYGDGVSNVRVDRLVEFHRRNQKVMTVTGVRPQSRFGVLEIEGSVARAFREKPRLHESWVNGGFFVMEPRIFSYLSASTALEADAMERLAHEEQLAVYEHDGYWASMDTYRDTIALNEEWNSGQPGWLRTDRD